MTRLWRSRTLLPVWLIVLLAAGGCSEGDNENQVNEPPPGAGGGPPGGGGPGGGAPGIRQIMAKLGRGPNALTPVIGNALQQDPPPWDTIQGQAKEYAQSAAELGKFDPPKGAKESWVKLTAAFADSGAELEKAAIAKDKEAARLSHDQLKNSCNACHQEHRRMGRGGGPGGPGGPPPGGPGGRGGFGRPPGGPRGPPPERPGGPPPGAPQ
jgi:hypothetical protein